MKLFILTHDTARARAIEAIKGAPKNYRVRITEPRRSTAQNDALWAHLTDISEQLKWHGQSLPPDDWKLIFMQALSSEMRIVPNLAGNGFVNLTRSSKLSVAEMSNLLELIIAYGVQNGVVFNDRKVDAA